MTSSGDPRGRAPGGVRGEDPWKPALFKNLNHNLYSKLIWDYYKMGCVILTRKLFNLPIFFFLNIFFLFLFLFFFNAEKWCGQSRTGRSGSDAPGMMDHKNTSHIFTVLNLILIHL